MPFDTIPTRTTELAQRLLRLMKRVRQAQTNDTGTRLSGQDIELLDHLGILETLSIKETDARRELQWLRKQEKSTQTKLGNGGQRSGRTSKHQAGTSSATIHKIAEQSKPPRGL